MVQKCLCEIYFFKCLGSYPDVYIKTYINYNLSLCSIKIAMRQNSIQVMLQQNRIFDRKRLVNVFTYFSLKGLNMTRQFFAGAVMALTTEITSCSFSYHL